MDDVKSKGQKEGGSIIAKGLMFLGGVTLLQAGASAAANKVISNIDYQIGKAEKNLNNIHNGLLQAAVPISILNGNSFDIKIDRFQGVISYGEVYIADLPIITNIVLTAGQADILTIKFEVNIQRFVLDATNNFLANGTRTLLNKIFLKGKIYLLGNSFTGSIMLPIETAIPVV